MARSFTSQDAQNVIRRHRDLQNRISALRGISTRYEKEVREYAGFLDRSYTFKRTVTNELLNGIGEQPETSTIRMFELLELLDRSKKIDDEIGYLDSVYSREISEALKLLSATSTNGLKWFFTSGQNKSMSEQAFAHLNELLESRYTDSISLLEADKEALQRISVDLTSINDYAILSRNWQLFQRTCPEICKYSTVPDEINTLTNRYRALESKCESLEVELEARKNAVKNAVDKMIAVELVQTLHGIPVEELNREGNSYRVKALAENGYTTMADVFCAQPHQLSSVYGVSETAANGMKQVAKKYANRIRPDVRIKISADSRTDESTKVVGAIYAYKIMVDVEQKIGKTRRKSEPQIRGMLNTIENVDDTVRWLFDHRDVRETRGAAYRSLCNLIDGEYGRELQLLIAQAEETSLTDNADAWNDFCTDNIRYFTILEELVPGVLGNGDGLYGLPEELAKEIQEECFFPDGLNCSLRRYQEWGVKYILHQERVLLGDEMGLGKTVQAIATMVSLKNTGATHFMIVCPASVLPNWCKEISVKSKLRATKIHGSGRKIAFEEWIKTGGVAVTTFETTAYCIPDKDFKFDLLIVDEAHYVKNPVARRTKNLKELAVHASRKLFMTGTALENTVDEMIQLISMLQPQIAMELGKFAFMSSAPQFRKRIAPVYYRRKREDVLTELPELIESEEWCAMTKEDEADYEESIMLGNFAAARRVSWNLDQLKQSSKACRLLELVEMATEDKRKVIVFSFFLDTIKKVQELLGDRCVQPINGSVPVQRRQEIIDEFDNAPAGTVLPAQIMSAGTGLNIQSASVVVFCEPQLKPSIENQAISRAYRMGQGRNVLVYRLLCENSLDEKIVDLLAEKQAVFDAFADESVAAKETREIDNNKLGDLIKEEIDRINAKRAQNESKQSIE